MTASNIIPFSNLAVCYEKNVPSDSISRIIQNPKWPDHENGQLSNEEN